MVAKGGEILFQAEAFGPSVSAAESYGKFLTGKYHHRVCTWVEDSQELLANCVPVHMLQ